MKILTITLIFILCTLNVLSQDTIIYKTGDELLAKVREVGITEIKYHKWTNQTGPIYSELKSNIFAIKYGNGSVDVFKEEKTRSIREERSLASLTDQERYLKGRFDAKKHYTHSMTYLVTGIPTVIFPPAGLVAGTIIAIIPPKVDNFNAPDKSLLKDPQYYAGYKKQAHNKKIVKTLAGFGIGIGAYIILLMAAY